ncbi:hypothetical protein BC628DRAFT_569142 [Trametes gibbosa]|nr:hypothetical protein BC628DRAFT_569142 [Trametes gibbosa]
MIAKAIDGRHGDDDACIRTVRQYWKNITAGLDREGEPVDPKIIASTTSFINDDLQMELHLPLFKRARKYAAMPHLVARLLWGHDWNQFGSPKDRLDLWDGTLLSVFTSARVGEYIESTGRGLRHKDVRFVVLRDEQGEPEAAMEVKKDGKGMTSTPWSPNSWDVDLNGWDADSNDWAADSGNLNGDIDSRETNLDEAY